MFLQWARTHLRFRSEGLHLSSPEADFVPLPAFVGVGLIENVPDRQLRVSNLICEDIDLFCKGRKIFSDDNMWRCG